MTAALEAVGRTGLSAAVMILAVMILRLRFQDRTPRRVFCLLWDLVLIRLLVPVEIASPVSILRLLPKAAPQTVTAVYDPLPVSAVMEGSMVVREAYVASVAEDTVQAVSAAVPPPVDWSAVLAALWMAGAVVLAAWFLWGHLRSRRIYAVSLPVKDMSILNWLAEHPLRRPVQARVSDRIAAPLTYGVLYPVILLPRGMDWGNAEVLSCVLSHEHTHIRRFDTLRKGLLAAALCLHWFNPLVWAMYILANRDMELACDEAVVRSGADRAGYAMALLGLEERRGGWSPTGSHFSGHALEERIKAIMKRKHISITALVAVLVVMAVTTTVFASAAPEGKTDADPHQNAPQTGYVYDHLGIVEDDGVTIMSKGGEDGEKLFSVDGGETWMSEERYHAEYGSWGDDWQVEWWTYEDYKLWLEEEKVALQSIIGERAYTSTDGWFTWDQEKVDEAIALYESILEDIKNGALYSKTIIDKNGNTVEDVALGSDGPMDMMIASTFEMGEGDVVVPKSLDKAALLDELQAFGIGGNENLMTYNGELIRYFVDGASAGDDGYSVRYVYTNDQGTVDVHTLRAVIYNPDGSYDTMGGLIGVAAKGDKGFDQGLIDAAAFSGEPQAATAVGNSDASGGRTFEEIFAQYEQYGLFYEPRESSMGALTYNGQSVRSFADLKPDGGTFSYQDPDAAEDGLTVYTQYDQDGKLAGLSAKGGTASVKPSGILWEDVVRGSNGSWRSIDFSTSASQGEGIQYWFRNDTQEACRVYLMQKGNNDPVSWMEVDANGEDQALYYAGAEPGEYYLEVEAYVSGGEIDGRARVEQVQTAQVRTEKQDLGFSYTAPVQGRLSTAFGKNRLSFHYGIDLTVEKGTDIGAFADGVVTEAGFDATLGNYVVLSHEGGYSTLYGHCASIAVAEGSSVAMGEKIAEAGATGRATGAVLHFELRDGSTYLDPGQYLDMKVSA